LNGCAARVRYCRPFEGLPTNAVTVSLTGNRASGLRAGLCRRFPADGASFADLTMTPIQEIILQATPFPRLCQARHQRLAARLPGGIDDGLRSGVSVIVRGSATPGL
jgi:hypothetical protein